MIFFSSRCHDLKNEQNYKNNVINFPFSFLFDTKKKKKMEKKSCDGLKILLSNDNGKDDNASIIDDKINERVILLDVYKQIELVLANFRRFLEDYRNYNIPGMMISSGSFKKSIIHLLKYVKKIHTSKMYIKNVDRLKLSTSINSIIIALKIFTYDPTYNDTQMKDFKDRGTDICNEIIMYLYTIKNIVGHDF